MDKILLHENENESSVKEAPEHFESNFYGNGLYHIDNMSIEDTKEKLE